MLWVFPPPMPVTVMVNVPVAALRLAFTVIVEFEPAVTGDGLKLALAPLPSPAADRLIEIGVPIADVVMVSVLELPLLTVTVLDVAPIVKSDDVAEVTVRPTVVVSVVPSEVFPVTVMGKLPVAAVELAVNERTEVPVPLTGLVPKLAVTPEGSAE